MGGEDRETERAVGGGALNVMAHLRPATLSEAKDLQYRLRREVKILPLQEPPAYIAGVDAGFVRDEIIAVASLYSFPAMEHREDAACREKTALPYAPGYLAFTEGHAIINALRSLSAAPDLILVDGQGIAHPRGIGIASHLGVILGIPSIGCAKSRLVGEFDDPAAEKGSWTYLCYEGACVGAVLRTRSNVKPVFVSPGHLTDIISSVELVMKCVSHYRIPDPLRRADMRTRELSRKHEDGRCSSSRN